MSSVKQGTPAEGPAGLIDLRFDPLPLSMQAK
jgi:hypothetical protein